MPTPVETFVVPPERYISTPVWEIVERATAALPPGKNGQDAKLRKVAQLLEGTAQFEFLAVRRRIKRNFTYFRMAAAGKKVPRAKGQGEPNAAELDRTELQFVEDFYRLLTAAHFRLLSAADWATAQAEQFTFTCPVEIHWERLDPSLLRRFWAAHDTDIATSGLAPCSDRILIFHRGITMVKAQGMFFEDKMDLLTQYLLMDPLERLYERIFKRKMKLPLGVASTSEGTGGNLCIPGPGPSTGVGAEGGGAKGSDPNLATLPDTAGIPLGNVVRVEEAGELRGAGANSGTAGSRATAAEDSNDARLQHDAAKVVQRVSLRQLLPNAQAVLRNLFKTLKICEPAFKNVVILYRRAVPEQEKKKSDYDPVRDVDKALVRRNIEIKRFDEIPMADAEMIFPDKTIFLKPYSVFSIGLAIAFGVFAGVTCLLSDVLSLQLLITFVSLVGTRAMQINNNAQLARTTAGQVIHLSTPVRYQDCWLIICTPLPALRRPECTECILDRKTVVDQVTCRLYDAAMDAQEGVVLFLLDQMAEQHVKQVLFAYTLLLQHAGQSMTVNELDGACEKVLQEEFGEALDFAVENCLPDLLQDGLATKDAQGRVGAVGLDEALRLLTQKWERFFEGVADGDTAPSLPPRFAEGPKSASFRMRQGSGSLRDTGAATPPHTHRRTRDRLRAFFSRSPDAGKDE